MRVRGVAGINRMLKDLQNRGETITKSIITATAEQVATDAKTTLQASQSDYHKIAQSISATKETDFRWFVGVNELPMGAYVEFGTGVFVDVPQGWEETAMQFYVNGKGYLKPYPYLIPAFHKGERQFKQDIRDAFVNLVEQFNRR